MQFFTEAAGKLPVLKDLKAALRNGISPVSLTGVSQIHKAQILLTLAQEQPLLAVLPDESAHCSFGNSKTYIIKFEITVILGDVLKFDYVLNFVH